MLSFNISIPRFNKNFLTLRTSLTKRGDRGGERRPKDRVEDRMTSRKTLLLLYLFKTRKFLFVLSGPDLPNSRPSMLLLGFIEKTLTE
jgi:hypothetical protein